MMANSTKFIFDEVGNMFGFPGTIVFGDTTYWCPVRGLCPLSPKHRKTLARRVAGANHNNIEEYRKAQETLIAGKQDRLGPVTLVGAAGLEPATSCV